MEVRAHVPSPISPSRYGLDPQDIFIDTLALPLSTGMVESRRDGIETIEAIRRIRPSSGRAYDPRTLQRLVGLNPAARQVLNSVFLHECSTPVWTPHRARVEAPAAHRIDEDARRVCLDLIYDDAATTTTR